jgi:hypothetical protein
VYLHNRGTEPGMRIDHHSPESGLNVRKQAGDLDIADLTSVSFFGNEWGDPKGLLVQQLLWS